MHSLSNHCKLTSDSMFGKEVFNGASEENLEQLASGSKPQTSLSKDRLWEISFRFGKQPQ